MILAISEMLRNEGVLYTSPPMVHKEGGGASTSILDSGGASTSILDKGGADDMRLVSQMGVYNLMPQVGPPF